MRVRLTAPRGAYVRLRYLDSIHGALVNAWCACGVRGTDVVGRDAGNWSFGAIGSATATGFVLRSLVVGAEGTLESPLRQLIPETIRKSSSNGDTVDLSSWDVAGDDLPLVRQPGQIASLGVIMLSPLAVSVRGRKGRWHDDLNETGPDLEHAVNFRLSRLTGRDVRLTIAPDRLYLKANPKHSTLVRTRAVRGAKPSFVIGMMCPLLISGLLEDLRSAWVLGIGEKNRYGFGCIGYAGSGA